MDGSKSDSKIVPFGHKFLLVFLVFLNIVTISLFVIFGAKQMYGEGCKADVSQLRKELENVKTDIKGLKFQISITEKVAAARSELLRVTRRSLEKKSKRSTRDLPGPVDPVIASLYKILDSMVLLRNSSAVSCCNGKRGPRGKSGPMGQKGERGERGIQGHQGPQGPSGIPGVKGNTGLRGQPGQGVERPVIKVRPQNSVVVQGSTGKFKCKASGNPKPIIKWYHKNALMKSGSKASLILDGTSLKMKNVSESDLGTVKCVAENLMGKAEANAMLTVYVQPSIRVPKRQISIDEGDNVDIQCYSSGIPKPKITWDRIGEKLSPNAKLLSNGFLRLQKARKTDAGVYTCKGRNAVASSAANVSLHVQALYKDCKETLSNRPQSQDGVYKLKSGKHYCNMSIIQSCGGRGWTLAMKLDGSKDTFASASHHWTTASLYNEVINHTPLSNLGEAKFPAFNVLAFNEICVGMQHLQQTKWLRLPIQAQSLLSLFKSGKYVSTSVGRNTWKSLITGSSLQYNCNREGINVRRHHGRIEIRIGIIGNEQDHCFSPDSVLGFGTISHPYCSSLPSISCGNIGTCLSDNGDKSFQATGYILVR